MFASKGAIKRWLIGEHKTPLAKCTMIAPMTASAKSNPEEEADTDTAISICKMIRTGGNCFSNEEQHAEQIEVLSWPRRGHQTVIKQ